jgi:hypothetical protein
MSNTLSSTFSDLGKVNSIVVDGKYVFDSKATSIEIVLKYE